jgi:UDP-glucose 4-epimerase
MKILILGSEGFIGSHLVNFFRLRNYDVTGVDFMNASKTDIKYYSVKKESVDYAKIFESNSFDACINAGGSGSVPFSILEPVKDFTSNVAETASFLDALKVSHPGCKYLHISSAAVYGNMGRFPNEASNNLQPISPYGFHKLMSENLCKEYSKIFNLQVAIIRPFSVYGPGLKKQLLWDICEKVKKNNRIELFGTGAESRDFVHIEDLCRLFEIILSKGDFNCGIYNAASGHETSISTVASIFEDYYKEEKKISFSGIERVGDPDNWCADIHKISGMGFNIARNFKEGVIEYIKWYEAYKL